MGLIEREVLVHLVGDDEQVALDRELGESASSSDLVRTAPVGLWGELSRISLVRGVTAARRRSTSREKAGGSSLTGTQRPRAIAIVAR